MVLHSHHQLDMVHAVQVQLSTSKEVLGQHLPDAAASQISDGLPHECQNVLVRHLDPLHVSLAPMTFPRPFVVLNLILSPFQIPVGMNHCPGTIPFVINLDVDPVAIRDVFLHDPGNPLVKDPIQGPLQITLDAEWAAHFRF